MNRDCHFYIIHVEGLLDRCWADWFGGMTITYHAGTYPAEAQPGGTIGETVLTGYVIDQPALHGLLHKIRDLNLPLLTVARLSLPVD